MPKAYILITEDVKDPAGMAEYGKLASQAMAGATLLSFDTKAEVIDYYARIAPVMVPRRSFWSSSRRTRPASGTTPIPIRRRRSCARPPPTATA